MLANKRGESLNTEKSKVQWNMSVRIQTQTLPSRAWRSQNTEDFCSLRGKSNGGERMMAGKLSCRCQSLPCSCAPAFPRVPGQREEMLMVQEGEKGSKKTAPAQPTPSQGCGSCWEGPQHFQWPSSSSVPQSLWHRDAGNVPRDWWHVLICRWICIHLPLSLHSFPEMPLRTSKTLSALDESNLLV